MHQDPLRQHKHIRCDCGRLPLRFFSFNEQSVGVDKTNGRFAEVSILTCRQCGQLWLRYFVQFEHQPKSGRWYMGAVTPDDVFLLLPQQAEAILREMPELIYGGSYYGHVGKIGEVTMELDA